MAKRALKLVVSNKTPVKVRFNAFAIPTYSPGCLCGNCGYSGWLIGRSLAECATPKCGMALPLPFGPLGSVAE